MSDGLLPHHREMIRQCSAIADDVIEARGYRSVTAKPDMADLGFSRPQSLVPTLVIPIWNIHGEVAFHHHRPDEPRRRNGKPVKYEFPRGIKMVVDVHPFVREAVRNPAIPLFVTEGVKKADAAISSGVCCIALLGVWNWRGTNEHGGRTTLPDWDGIALKGRIVYVVFDSDAASNRSVQTAMIRLKEFLDSRGAQTKIISLPPCADGSKVGLDDYLASGKSLDVLLESVASDRTLPENRHGPEGGKLSAAQRLIQIGMQAELFPSDRDEPFCRFRDDGKEQTWPVRSSAFRGWLTLTYYKESGKSPSSQTLEEALRLLEAKALFEGRCHPLAVRMARGENGIWMDLADSQWRTVHIGPHGWQVVPTAIPMFRRYAVQAASVEPTQGGQIEMLRQYVRVRDEQAWRQLVAWLVACFFPDIAHPVLVVHGEQGSAKSSLMRLLSLLVDPSRVPLRSEPRELCDWILAADHSWLITLDNVSNLPGWLSDAICRAVTGEGFVKRQLYTDADDIIVSFRRVVALTGIGVVAERADLLDRSILMCLEPLTPENRLSEEELLASFEANRSAILGALLTAVSGVLTQLPHVHVDRLPRMADFARIGVAVEHVLGWPQGSFLHAYSGNIAEQNDEALSASPVGETIMDFLSSHPGGWSGTAQDLLRALEDRYGEKVTKRQGWPRVPRSLGNQLRRIAPNLRSIGFDVAFDKNHGGRMITFCRRRRENSAPSAASSRSHQPGNQGAAENSPGAAGDADRVTQNAGGAAQYQRRGEGDASSRPDSGESSDQEIRI